MSQPVRILGIAGSLRRGSYNRAALRAATQLVPEGITLDIFDIDGIPAFNQDEEQKPPAKVVELKKRIREADAILIVTPEYNYSIPGVLKNAIDWASRPYGDSAWSGKPAAIIGASIGTISTARAQYHLVEAPMILRFNRDNQHGARAISPGRSIFYEWERDSGHPPPPPHPTPPPHPPTPHPPNPPPPP